MPIHSPKQILADDAEHVKAHRAIVDNPFFSKSLALVQAEFAMGNPSSEQLKGINDFISMFLNFAEKEQEIRAAFPHKHIERPTI